MNETPIFRRDAERRGGFTLIEVVIALAIFVFGAVAIIRIFPPALGVIQNSGDKLTALNLNRTTLSKFTNNPNFTPTGIYNDDYFGPKSKAYSVVGSALDNRSLPFRNVQDATDSALNQFKWVSGERQKVRKVTVRDRTPFPTTRQDILYVLTSFPVASQSATNFTPRAKIYKDTPLAGVVTYTDNVAGRQQSGFLDFTNAVPDVTSAGYINDQNFFYVNYSFLERGPSGTGSLLNKIQEEAVRTRNSFGTPVAISQGRTNFQLLQGRRLGQTYTPNNTGDPPSPNRVSDGPVQVRLRQLLNPVIATTDDRIQDALNNLGILILNSANVSEGDEVSVDYRVNSWNQLVSDSTPSIQPEETPTPGPVTSPAAPADRSAQELVLPLRFLADGSDGSAISPAVYSLLNYMDPAFTDTAIMQTGSVSTAPLETLQVNRLSPVDGSPVGNASDQPIVTTSSISFPASTDPSSSLAVNNPFSLWDVDRKRGRVVFDVKDNISTAPTTPNYQILSSRVVYQTQDNWTHQVSVAPQYYTPYYGDTINNSNGDGDFTSTIAGVAGINVAQPWRYYMWQPQSATPDRIYFPTSEAGKTISISYTYGTAANPIVVTNKVVTIRSDWVDVTGSAAPLSLLARTQEDRNGNSEGEKLAFVEPQIDPVSGTPTPLLSIQSIRGLSIQARTAWLDGANFSQVSTVGFRGASN